MSEEFKNKIKKLIADGEELFYNSKGNKEAYKLCVKHVSVLPSFNLGFLVDETIHLHDKINLVDFENETIYQVEDTISIIPLIDFNS